MARFLDAASVAGRVAERHSAKREILNPPAPLSKSTFTSYVGVISFKRCPPQVSKSMCGGEAGKRRGLKFVLQQDPWASARNQNHG
jgi:hypothetical protein